jgi:hypothetical protein
MISSSTRIPVTNNNVALDAKVRTLLTKSILSYSSNTTAHQTNSQRNARDNLQQKDRDFPVLNSYTNNNNYRGANSNVLPIATSKRIDELATNVRRLDEILNRLIDLNNSYCGQLNNIHNLIMKHDHVMQIQQVDISFNHGLVSQFI